jgi:hypothetical protein
MIGQYFTTRVRIKVLTVRLDQNVTLGPIMHPMDHFNLFERSGHA